MSTREPDLTWDQKVGRRIRGFLSGLLGPRPEIDDWEHAKMEMWQREEEQGRMRSSQELHEELERRQGF